MIMKGVVIRIALIAISFIIILCLFVSCGIRFSLPDRNHPNCKIPWDQRKPCLDSSDCAPEHECAHRGFSVGRCTYFDCCEPWRNRRLERGKNWCGLEEDEAIYRQSSGDYEEWK